MSQTRSNTPLHRTESADPLAPRKRSTLETPVTSLLWPAVRAGSNSEPEALWVADLGLDPVIRAFTSDSRYAPFIRRTLTALVTDLAVIEWRQAVMEDFLRSEAFCAQITALLPHLADLRQGSALFGQRRRSLLFETADRLAELELFLSVVQEMVAILQSAELRSQALEGLREGLRKLSQDPQFIALREDLPELRRPLQNLASITVGINLDSQLKPTAAVLLTIQDKPFAESKSFLDRLLGLRVNDEDESGIAPMHHTPRDPEHRPLSPLFQDLERLVTQAAQPIARALGKYVKVSSSPLTALENELAFFVGAANMIRGLEKRGITFCKPEIVPVEVRLTDMRGLVNLALALRTASATPLIANEARLDDEGRIALLTGPNSGGKTTFLQAVGLAHMLFQAGLFIPAQTARISPIDMIYTHFPALETQQQGRLSEESARLRAIFLRASAQSLILMNESLASTTSSEALYLAQDLIAGLRMIGVRAIFATHLIELAERIPEIEAMIEGPSRICSWVAGIAFIEAEGGAPRAMPTFQIARGTPLGRGYAQEIARRHGISLAQIVDARRVSTDQKLS